MIAVILKSGHSIKHPTADSYEFGEESGRLYILSEDKEVAVYSRGWQGLMIAQVQKEEGQVVHAVPGNDGLAQPAAQPEVPPDPDWYNEEDEDDDE